LNSDGFFFAVDPSAAAQRTASAARGFARLTMRLSNCGVASS